MKTGMKQPNVLRVLTELYVALSNNNNIDRKKQLQRSDTGFGYAGITEKKMEERRLQEVGMEHGF